MKRTNIARVALLVGLVWIAGACDQGLTEVNDNPNQPTDVPVDFLLPQSIQTGVQQNYGAGEYLSHTGIWPQHIVELQYPDEEQGQVRASRMEGYWTTYFAGALKDIQTVIDKGVENSAPNHQAVGMIWKSWLFAVVTDLWGDVPYSEALRGEEGQTTPVYDAQQDIYDGVLADLTTAVGMLSASGRDFGTGDIIYDNDMAAWAKFANSLRMRLAMRMVNADAATAQSEFMAAYNDANGHFTSNADNAVLNYPGAPYENPLYENYLGRDDHGVSATLIDTLTSLADPRLELYAEPASVDGVYRGHENGRADLPVGQSLAWFSRIGNFWRADGSATPSVIMSYAEVKFLEAEAIERGWIAGGAAAAEAAWREGIQASMDQYDAWSPANAPTNAEVAAYLASLTYGGMNDIYLQKWIALYMNGSEAWSDWRRTGVPTLTMGADMAAAISRIPARFSYPDSEQSLNNANMTAAVSRQGGGLDVVTPVWWMP